MWQDQNPQLSEFKTEAQTEEYCWQIELEYPTGCPCRSGCNRARYWTVWPITNRPAERIYVGPSVGVSLHGEFGISESAIEQMSDFRAVAGVRK